MHWCRLCVCLRMQTRSSCCVPPVVPSGPLCLQAVPLGSQELGLWLRPAAWKNHKRFPKLLLAPATERTNCLIALFSVPSFYCTLQVWAWAPLFSRPGRSSNICNTKQPNCTKHSPGLNRALFFLYVLQRRCND